MRRTTDRRVALEEIAPGLSFGLVESLARMATMPERLEAVARWVGERIARLALRQDHAVTRAAERIEATRGRVEMPELLAESGLGRRQFERRFGDQVGIGPALLASVLRFRRVFDVIERGGPRPWTDAAIEAGYFDQSHLNRDFRRFVGCTPTEFAASRPGLASALVE
jgi:methylphosphotriester-DNA--protein-cysteine methyltransferase